MTELEKDRTNELIWHHDFKSGAVASTIGTLRVGEDKAVRTYGELATFSEVQLLEAGILKDELPLVKTQLIKRNLQLYEPGLGK